jgi:hypothetical protein
MDVFRESNHSDTPCNPPEKNDHSQDHSSSQNPSPHKEYRVFHIYYHGSPRDHQAIFVETHENGKDSGHQYHVIGSILNGMEYNNRMAVRPEDNAEVHEKHQIGNVKQSDLAQLEVICRGIEVPSRQMDLRGRKLDNSKPLRRCGEWTVDAINELQRQGILIT